MIDHVSARLALGAVTVLVPAAPIEVSGNAANLHWYFLWLAPWLLMAAPTRWLTGIALGVVALLAGLTEIQVALFVPLVLVEARNRYRLPVVVGLLLGVAAQVVATLTSPRSDPYGSPPNLHDLVEAYPVHVVVPVWMPKFHGRAGHRLRHLADGAARVPAVRGAGRGAHRHHRGPAPPAPPGRPAGPGDRGVLPRRRGGPVRGRLLAQPRRAARHA